MADDFIEPFPFDVDDFAVIETFVVGLALVDMAAVAVDRRVGTRRGTPGDIVLLKLVPQGGDDDLSCAIPLPVLAQLRDTFDDVLKEVEERNRYVAELEQAGLAGRLPQEAQLRPAVIDLLVRRHTVAALKKKPTLIDDAIVEAHGIPLEEQRKSQAGSRIRRLLGR